MAFDFVINAENGIVFSYGCGALTFQEVRAHRACLAADKRFSPEFRQILHVSDVIRVEISGDEIRSLTTEFIFAPRSRRALVAATDSNYGMGRVFVAYSEGQTVRIFRSLDEAAEWVEVSLELATAIYEDFRRKHGVA